MILAMLIFVLLNVIKSIVFIFVHSPLFNLKPNSKCQLMLLLLCVKMSTQEIYYYPTFKTTTTLCFLVNRHYQCQTFSLYALRKSTLLPVLKFSILLPLLILVSFFWGGGFEPNRPIFTTAEVHFHSSLAQFSHWKIFHPNNELGQLNAGRKTLLIISWMTIWHATIWMNREGYWSINFTFYLHFKRLSFLSNDSISRHCRWVVHASNVQCDQMARYV